MKTNTISHPGSLFPGLFTPLLTIAMLFGGMANTAFSAVVQYVVAKEERLNQTSTAAPTLDPTRPFRLNTQVTVAAQTDLSSNPTATAPAGGTGTSPLTLTYNAGNGNYENKINFLTRIALDTAYLDGTYTMHMVSPAFGTKDVNLTLNPASYTFPTDIPKLTNTTWSGGVLQLDPSVNNTLSWNSFTQLAGNDFVMFGLAGPSVNINQTGNLTSYFIPANTLTIGNTYTGDIGFEHATTSDTSSVSGATGLGGYGTGTRFTIQPIPEPASWATLSGGVLVLLGRKRIRRCPAKKREQSLPGEEG